MQVKCDRESYQCRRCQVTSSVCTYQSLQHSKRRLSAPDLEEEAPQPPAKRNSWNRDTAHRHAPNNWSSLEIDLGHAIPYANPKEGFPTPATLLGSEIGGDSCDWSGLQLQDLHNSNSGPQSYRHMSLETFTLPQPEDVTPRDEASAGQNSVAPSSSVTSQAHDRECKCISVLANSLERINSDTDNDVNESDQLDHLLVHLHDGIKACKEVKLCKRCSVHTTNSMIVVTLIQQLAAIVQALSLHLVKCQQRASTISSVVGVSQSLRADIHVGEYKVQATSLHLKFLFPIASMYIKDLQQLLEHLQGDMKKGTKTFKLLNAAANMVQKADRSLPT